jgi:hypothetical protein
MSVPHSREPLQKGLDEAAIEGFNINYKVKEKLIYFYCLSVNYNNCSPTVGNDSQNGIHCCRRAAIIYELTNNTIMNNRVACCRLIMTIIMLFCYDYSNEKSGDN